MPVIFTIGEEDYSYPEGWQDVELSEWLEALKIEMPEELRIYRQIPNVKDKRKYADEVVNPIYGIKIIPYFAKVVQFWCKLPDHIVGNTAGKDVIHTAKIRVGDEEVDLPHDYSWLEMLYQQIERNLDRSIGNYTDAQLDTIKHNNQTWYLPSKHLKKATLNEFIEASQAEHLAEQLKGNQLHALPKLLCIFLKSKKDAPFNPKQMEREGMFLKMTMDKVFKVSFFLLKLNEKLLSDFHIYTAILRLAQLRNNVALA